MTAYAGGAEWPFGDDADRSDPLTILRIAVTHSRPTWSYLVAFDRESSHRPTDAEAAMLVSFLDEYKAHYYRDSGYGRRLASLPLDVDGIANGTIFRKYGTDDWGYRRQSWTRGPMYIPQSPGIRERYPDESPLGPLGLAQVMDHAHQGVDGIRPRWLAWKAAHPEVFPPG